VDSLNEALQRSFTINKKIEGLPQDIKHQRITIRQVAEYCMVSNSTVQRWLKEGKLKSLKLPSNQKRISVADFMDFLQRYQIHVSEEFFRRK